MMEGPCTDSEEKHEPVSDIDTVLVDSLKALDSKRPESHDGRALAPIPKRSTSPVSDIDTVLVDSLKALDSKRPIREADIRRTEQAYPKEH